MYVYGLPRWLSGKKNPPTKQETWVGNIPWRRAWQPTPVFLLGKCHGQGPWQATVHRITKNQTQLSN